MVKDYRAWLIAFAYFFALTALDCLIVLSPAVVSTAFDIGSNILRNTTGEKLEEIIANDEDGTIPASLLATIPYILSGFIAWGVSFHSDKTNERGYHCAIPLAVSSVGFLLLALMPPEYSGAGPARYFIGLFPAVGGLMTAVPSMLSFAMDKIQGDTTRATMAAVTVGIGHAFGLAIAGSPDLMNESNAPTYPGMCILCSAFSGAACGLIFLVHWYNQQNEHSVYQAPGLRRLMNDQDEAKAWDVELNNLDFLKSADVGKEGFAGIGQWEDDDRMESAEDVR